MGIDHHAVRTIDQDRLVGRRIAIRIVANQFGKRIRASFAGKLLRYQHSRIDRYPGRLDVPSKDRGFNFQPMQRGGRVVRPSVSRGPFYLRPY